VEANIPNPIPLPGAKLGLANLVTLLAISLFGFQEGILVALLRVILSSLVTGTFLTIAFFLSLAGAINSACFMGFLYRYQPRYFSLIGVSVAGAVAHNLGQFVVAYLIIGHRGLFLYLPYLTLFALPTGFFNGLIVTYLRQGLIKAGLSKL
jgi:heptaprenyl diphosphate synthase